MNEILIIGASPNLLDTKNGAEIDKYEYVCRFNDFQTEGFEDYVGTKTTHWVTGVSHHAMVKGRDIEGLIVLCAYNLGVFRGRKSIERRKAVIKDRLDINPDETREISEPIIKSIMNKTGINYLSTGLIGTGYFLFTKKYKVTITGFDHFQSEKQHYYTDKTLESISAHSWEKEKILFDKWIEDEIIEVI